MDPSTRQTRPLSPEVLSQLRRWSTPTVFNGWEQFTHHDAAADAFNVEDVRDFMPDIGPMVGYAVTAVVRVSDSSRRATNGQAWAEFRRHVAAQPGPKIVVVQDLDKPRVVGSIWGEVSATIYRGLGCVGTITDGGIRDVTEMTAVGFKALARRLCVGHGHGALIEWGRDVTVFGRTIRPGQLIHADQHGFLAIPHGDEEQLLEAAAFMDGNEAKILSAGQTAVHALIDEHLAQIDRAIASFGNECAARFCRTGEQR